MKVSETKTLIEAMSAVALSILQDGKRCDCVSFATRYNKGARQSKPMIELMRRKLSAVRSHLRENAASRVLTTPVSDLFYKNGYDQVCELDDDAISKSLPHKDHPTYGLVLSADYPKIAIAHANSLNNRGEGVYGARIAENTMLVEQKIAHESDLITSIFKIDQRKHMEVFLKDRNTPLLEYIVTKDEKEHA